VTLSRPLWPNFAFLLLPFVAYTLAEFEFSSFNRSRDMESVPKFKQVAQLSQRDRAAGWVDYGQKWKTPLPLDTPLLEDTEENNNNSTIDLEHL